MEDHSLVKGENFMNWVWTYYISDLKVLKVDMTQILTPKLVSITDKFSLYYITV